MSYHSSGSPFWLSLKEQASSFVLPSAVLAAGLAPLVFLRAAGASWFNALLAGGGLLLIVTTLLGAIRAIERGDIRAGRDNLARIAATEARDAEQARAEEAAARRKAARR